VRGWRRNKPAPIVSIDPADRLIAAYAGFTPSEWAELPELVRRDHREHVAWDLP